MAELYDIEENSISKQSKSTQNLFQLDNSDTITSTQYSLLKLPSENKYFIAFAQSSNVFIKIFQFNGPSFNFDGYEETCSKLATSYNGNSKTISLFLLEDVNILVLFYLKSHIINDVNDDYVQTISNYSMIFYHPNDPELDKINEQEGYSDIDPIPGDEHFFKGLDLGGNYSAIIYSKGSSEDFQFALNISKLNYDVDYSPGYYGFTTTGQKLLKRDDNINANADLILNEFIKINNRKLVLITTEGKIDSKPDK